jgi:protein-tyrosine phosphatase
VVRNFSWVIPDRLAGAAVPGEGGSWGLEYLLADLRELVGKGIRRLVSLTDQARHFGPACRRVGLKWTYFPIRDFDVPRRDAGFDDLVEGVRAEAAAGRAVCVHCYAGIGRTGLVLACVLGRYCSIDGQEAIRRLRDLRPALETGEQERFVRRYLRTTR